VSTKEKKGRLTDLVVNGQQVEATTRKAKKGKGDKKQQIEIIQVLPQENREMRSFAFRSDGGMERRVERQMEGRKDFRFGMPDVDERQFRMAPDGRLNRTYRQQRPDGNPNGDERRAQLDGLRGAERGLRTAAAVKGLNADQRKEINKELEKVRAQIKQAESAASSRQSRMNGDADFLREMDVRVEMQDHQQEMQDRQEEMRYRQQEGRDRQQELQERRRELQERIREPELRDLEQEPADRGRERADRDRDQQRADQRAAQHEALVAELRKDGLIQDKDNFQLRLTSKGLTVNGKEQPASVHQKYLKRYEVSTGRKMSATNAMVITRNGSSSSFSSSDGPQPPRPPRAPMAPMAPPMPPMPAPPAPPTPPRIDTEMLRDELRKDGVIGRDDKNLQFQLNASGLTVNGKKQSDELAAKYRKFTNHDKGKTFNMTISTQE